MSKIMADWITIPIEQLANRLDWGSSQERAKKVIAIREIRAKAQELIEQYKSSEYQLEYLKQLYPGLEDILESEYSELPQIDFSELSDRDVSKDYLSKEEWNSLSTTERNQLALDRYVQSHKKSKWQIGRDYELYVGYKYSQKGYEIDYFGSYMGLEDLGRDIISQKNGHTLIIQCKYWSEKKLIHENHIAQLYGTTICYCLEHKVPVNFVSGVLVTNITVSDKAREFAEFLNITIKDNYPIGEFPRIKCNLGKDEFGYPTKIYHLPFDKQYDITKITKKEEFFALTVKEAEQAGFRRTYKWHGD